MFRVHKPFELKITDTTATEDQSPTLTEEVAVPFFSSPQVTPSSTNSSKTGKEHTFSKDGDAQNVDSVAKGVLSPGQKTTDTLQLEAKKLVTELFELHRKLAAAPERDKSRLEAELTENQKKLHEYFQPGVYTKKIDLRTDSNTTLKLYTFDGVSTGITNKGTNKTFEGAVDSEGNLYIIGTENHIGTYQVETNGNADEEGHYLKYSGTNHLNSLSKEYLQVPEATLVYKSPDANIKNGKIEGRLVYVTKFCAHGNFPNYIKKDKTGKESKTLDAIAAVLKAHCELSQNNLVHLDIKKENILVDSEGQFRLGDTDGVIDLEQYQNKYNTQGVTFQNAAPGTQVHPDSQRKEGEGSTDQTRVEQGCKDDTYQIGLMVKELVYGESAAEKGKSTVSDQLFALALGEVEKVEEESEDPMKKLISLMTKHEYDDRINGPTALAIFERIRRLPLAGSKQETETGLKTAESPSHPSEPLSPQSSSSYTDDETEVESPLTIPEEPSKGELSPKAERNRNTDIDHEKVEEFFSSPTTKSNP